MVTEKSNGNKSFLQKLIFVISMVTVVKQLSILANVCIQVRPAIKLSTSLNN